MTSCNLTYGIINIPSVFSPIFSGLQCVSPEGSTRVLCFKSSLPSTHTEHSVHAAPWAWGASMLIRRPVLSARILVIRHVCLSVCLLHTRQQRAPQWTLTQSWPPPSSTDNLSASITQPAPTTLWKPSSLVSAQQLNQNYHSAHITSIHTSQVPNNREFFPMCLWNRIILSYMCLSMMNVRISALESINNPRTHNFTHST